MLEPILSTKQMQIAEQYTFNNDGISSLELQEFAGHAVAREANKKKLNGGRFVIFTGIGNNASDGFVAARLLRQKGIQVTVIPLFPLDKLKSDTAKQARLATEAGVKIRPATSNEDLIHIESWLKRAVIIIDAIFGTGSTRPITGWIAEAIRCINQSNRPILSVDIPSGIHSDTGEVLGSAIQASYTLPIAAYKWGHWLRCGKEYCGQILAPAHIGISSKTLHNAILQEPIKSTQSVLIDSDFIKSAFPERPPQSHKKTFGHLWIFGGSKGFTGAPRLCAMGAQAVGTGLVSIACPDDVYPIIASQSLEVMVHPQKPASSENSNSIVAGPGWGKDYKSLLHNILISGSPVTLDADALNILATNTDIHEAIQNRAQLTVLTPHPGEAARLLGRTTGEIQEDRLDAALALVDKYKSWVVLKGMHTLVVSPQKHVWLNPFGSAKLAVAGTGDVLSGMIGGLLASGIQPEVAIPAAVALHGLVGEQPGWHKAGQLENLIARKVQSFF